MGNISAASAQYDIKCGCENIGYDISGYIGCASDVQKYLNPFPFLLVVTTIRVLYASLTPPVTSGDGSRATVGRVRIRRKEIQPPRPAARRCTRLLHGLRSLKACSVDVPQTYGDGDAFCMRARQDCAPTLTVHAQWVPRLLPSKRIQA